MDQTEYEKDLGIDPHSLDEDWLRQPGLFMKYSVFAADAEKRRNQAKEKIDVVKAELDRSIRSASDVDRLAKYKMEKLTENSISATILLQPEYKEARDALTEAEYELSILQGAVKAFDHKRAALENEVKLWLGSYFAGPKEPRDIPGGKRIVDIARDRMSERMRDQVNRKPALVDKVQEETEEKLDQPTRRRRVY
jgi:hypothetical protein